MRLIASTLAVISFIPITLAGDGNRLAYLDECDPYYPNRTFPKLITPQWVGEDGVEAVVVLAIDDMRGHERWEKFLRPILNRLKKIDGRAPVSIMKCTIDPIHPHLQAWLKEGVSLECHTVDHPCPLLQGGDFAKAKSTYDGCVDLLNLVPNNKPVAFRVPCCDSLNTPSPCFYAEIFNKTTPHGNFLQIDSSVMNLFTANDPDLPRELVLEKDGSERFRKYLPRDRTFINTIEDFPYPYVIGRTCWEIPCVTPSDWSAQHYHKQNAGPVTLRDWRAALDCTVKKQGIFCLIFHPYDWSTPQMILDRIDHATTKHGKKVKFLNFRECLERLNAHLLKGRSLREENTGNWTGGRIIPNGPDTAADVGIPLKSGRLEVSRWKAEEKKMRFAWWEEALPAVTDRSIPLSDFKVFQVFVLGDYTAFAAANVKQQLILVQDGYKGNYRRARFSLPPGAMNFWG